ncbi:hypothetical protein CYMTET_3150 [Cymbomonas tetramitiformis]|uniref:RNA-directed DNA polymerase n=1 Tax=Cymbomonas tetramitiformis TaxID=36881 RepID=A0AAE0H3X8_9CHLO|nr:hypothetical protein CYMTET_3150 [Cymbomonas tetramitiformis]
MQQEADPATVYQEMFAEDMPEVPSNSGDTPSEGDDSGGPVGVTTPPLSIPEISESPTHASADEQMSTPDNDLNFTQQMMAAGDQDSKPVADHNDAATTTHVSPSTTMDAQLSVLDSHPLDDDDLGGSRPLDDNEEDDDDPLKCERVCSDGSVRWGPTEYLASAQDPDGPLLLVFFAYLKGHRVKVLVDSGASDIFVSEDCARRCKLTTRSGPAMRVTLADGSVKTTGHVAYSKFTARTTTGTYTEQSMAMRVLPLGIAVDMVLGGKWLRSLSPITLDYDGNGAVSFSNKRKGGGAERVTISGCNPGISAAPEGRKGKRRGDVDCAGLIDEVFLTSVQLKKHLVAAETRRFAGDASSMPAWLMMAARTTTGESAFKVEAEDLAVEKEDISKIPTGANDEPKNPVSQQDSQDADATAAWKKKFKDLFDEFEQELRDSLPSGLENLRHADEDQAKINLKPDREGGPPCRRPYKMSVEELRQLRERIEQLVEKGYIRPSSSPYAAPCLMVPKPGQPHILRLVCDFRQLNSQTIRDRYPLPDIQMMFDEMQGATHFSTFDAVDGFWQVPMAPEDVEKTAFTTQMGAYEWLVMPQGLQNSPSQYQRRMQRALGHLPFVRIFIDDVCVYTSGTVEEHYSAVRTFLLTCREKGVYLKKSKAQMLKSSIKFLGHTLSKEGCQPQHDKVAAVRDWPALENVTHVRQFLGLAGYYRRFIHCFSEIAQPLTKLTKTDVPWTWGPEQQWAFEELKAALVKAPILALPNMKAAADGSAPFLVQTDASGVALGGVLMQDCGNGLKVIAYESRQFSAAEQNYHTGERELGALHHCCTVTWRHYLIFTEFKLQGDHRPLEWLMEPGRELSRRQARWYMDLVEVGVPRMEYVKGALLLVPDALSRRPDYVVKSPRDGLKEAGVLDDKSDLPKTSLAAMDTSHNFEEGPSKSYPAWHAEQQAYLHAVDTLQIAEKAMEATLAFKSRGKYLRSKTLDKRITSKVKGVSDKVAEVSIRTEDTQTTQQKSGGLERTLRRSPRSQVLRVKEDVETSLRDAASERGDVNTKVTKQGEPQNRRSVPSALKGDVKEDQSSEVQEQSAEAPLPSQRQPKKSVRFQAAGWRGEVERDACVVRTLVLRQTLDSGGLAA